MLSDQRFNQANKTPMKTNSDAYLQRDDIHSQGVMKTPMIHKEESKNGDDLKVQNFIDGKS
jgi:hypothetical protein